MEQAVADFIEKYGIGLYIPKVHVTDVIEVLILTFLIYQIIVWIKNTKAWMLLRLCLLSRIERYVSVRKPERILSEPALQWEK